MTHRLHYTAIIATLFVAFSCLGELELPNAPDGFTWKKILKNQAAVLHPDGWHWKEQHAKGTDAFFSSKEDIDQEGEFKTGLSLNVIYELDRKAKVPPSRYAAAFINKMEERPRVEVLKKTATESDPFVTFICRNHDTKPGGENVIVHHFLIANDETGTLWMYIFEAPEKEWDEAWKVGEVLLQHIAVESEI